MATVGPTTQLLNVKIDAHGENPWESQAPMHPFSYLGSKGCGRTRGFWVFCHRHITRPPAALPMNTAHAGHIPILTQSVCPSTQHT